MSEIWGFVATLEVAWEQGFCQVLVECDLRIVVQFTAKQCDDYHPYYRIVQQWHLLCDRDWEVHIVHIYREANKLEDWMVILMLFILTLM
jgi:hypothetical protein